MAHRFTIRSNVREHGLDCRAAVAAGRSVEVWARTAPAPIEVMQ